MYHKFKIIAIGFEKNPEKSGFFVKFLSFSALRSIIRGLFLEKLLNSRKISRILAYSPNFSFGDFAVSKNIFKCLPKLFDFVIGVEYAKTYPDRATVGCGEGIVGERGAMVARAQTKALP